MEMPKETEVEGAVKKAYDRMVTDRQWYLTEGKDSAELTIPSILATDLDASNIVNRNPYNETINKPWQSVGAKGVRNLASKLGLTLFPPQGAFMRYALHPKFEKELNQPGNEAQRTEIEAQLAVREKVIMDDIEMSNTRTKVDFALRLLIVTGNALIYLPPSGGLRVFPLNHYVVRRDFTGNVVELIYLEMLDNSSLPAPIKKVLEDNGRDPVVKDGTGVSKKNSVAVYTRLQLEGQRFRVTQEVEGYPVDLGGKTSIQKDKMPFLALRFITIDGENYGRGFVEEIRGDLRSLEELRKAIVIGSLNAAKLIPMIQPGAVVTPKKLMEAENGAAIFGRPDDVTMLQQNKHGDFSVAQRTSMELTQTLQAAFLLNSSYQRDAERVTAEEIRRMAEELEDALGGIYSVLSQELQLPLARRTEERLIKNKTLSEINPKDAVKPVIVTGLAALGRGHEFNRNREFFAFLAREIAPLVPDIGSYLIARDAITRAALGLGVPTEGLIKTDAQMQEEAQAAQRQNMQQTMMEGAAPGLGQVAAAEMGSKVSAQMAGEGEAPAEEAAEI